MSLPRFAAEASLYKSERVYRGYSAGACAAPGVVAASARIPQITIGDIVDFLECWLDCVVVIGGRPGPCLEVCADIFL